jgi:small multidrug resistance family-3 protein
VAEGDESNALHVLPNPGKATRIPGWHDGPVNIPAETVSIGKTAVLFILAAAAEIGGAWLVWQAVREGKDWWWAGLGVVALGLYGFVATLQPDAHFGRILAAYGGVFVAGSLAWGVIFDGFRPDRWDIAGSVICLLGVAVIMFAPRNAG